MTVCIASICGDGTIFGAADTMLTAGDVEFEPAHLSPPRFGKIANITSAIAVMMAGDTAVHAEIMYSYVVPAVDAWIKKFSPQWMPVEEAVNIYTEAWQKIRFKNAERDILRPLGFTYESFLKQQKETSPEKLSHITKALAEYALEPTAAIITGVEPSLFENSTYSRLFAIHGAEAVCFDTIRFAAVGSGFRHAESHFMSARHGAGATVSATLFNTYCAKRKAEIAPGVGSDTNMFVITPTLGSFTWLRDDVMEKLKATYETTVVANDGAVRAAYADIDTYLAAEVERVKANTQQDKKRDNPKPPSNQ
jgi:hypothetical protein